MPNTYDKGHVQEFSITEENEDELPGHLPGLPSQTDPEGLEYSASGGDGPASFDGRSQLQAQNAGHKSGELFGMLEQTPQFIPPSKEASHNVSLDRHRVEEVEPNAGMRKFDIIDSPAKEQQFYDQHIETAQVTVETKG